MMDLRDFMTDQGIEARYTSVGEMRKAAAVVEDPDIQRRLLIAAALRELLEKRDREIVDGLLGRLEADSLDDVTIILELSTQEAVEEELRTGNLSHQSPKK
jgi:hypothetical protein